jgi:hypothetical protein
MLDVDMFKISPSFVQTPKTCTSKKYCNFLIFIEYSLNKKCSQFVQFLFKITIFSPKL